MKKKLKIANDVEELTQGDVDTGAAEKSKGKSSINLYCLVHLYCQNPQ
jgi:hypothetical protein